MTATRRQVKINRYKGGNERIDALLKSYWPEDEFYFVNGPQGRKPIWADSEDEAFSVYVDKWGHES